MSLWPRAPSSKFTVVRRTPEREIHLDLIMGMLVRVPIVGVPRLEDFVDRRTLDQRQALLTDHIHKFEVV